MDPHPITAFDPHQLKTWARQHGVPDYTIPMLCNKYHVAGWELIQYWDELMRLTSSCILVHGPGCPDYLLTYHMDEEVCESERCREIREQTEGFHLLKHAIMFFY